MIDLEALKLEPRCPEGWARANYVEGLIDFCQQHVTKDTNVVELGTFDGISTAVFSVFARTVVTIDAFPRPATILNDCPNVSRTTGDTFAMAALYPDHSLDLVYLDTDHYHDWVKREIHAWRPKVKHGGILSGHDFHPNMHGVTQAVMDIFGFPDRVYSDSSWMIRLN